jgi:serine/threonine protein kinase
MAQLPAPGDRIHQYTVLFEVARGGMAAVYAASVSGPGGFEKVVALKTILPALAGEPRFATMFLDEARIAARINHPNVVQMYEVREHDGAPVLAMELVAGRSLAAIRQISPGPSLRARLAILAGAARGLHAAHETLGTDGAPLGIVHRDVSPQNVLVGLDGQVKVTDFGIAAARGRITHTASGEMKGKMSYLAPEQITRESPTDRRADVWGLGVVAWELLAERKLFEGTDDAQRMFSVLSQDIPDLRAIVPDVPEGVAVAVARALERDVSMRLESASRLADVFEHEAAKLGARPSDIAEFMRPHFGSELERDRDRLNTSLTELSTTERRRSPRVLGWIAAAIAFLLVMSAAAATVIAMGSEPELPSPDPIAPAEPPAAVVVPRPEPETAEVLHVDEAPIEHERPSRNRRRRSAPAMNAAAEPRETPMRLDPTMILPNPF